MMFKKIKFTFDRKKTIYFNIAGAASKQLTSVETKTSSLSSSTEIKRVASSYGKLLGSRLKFHRREGTSNCILMLWKWHSMWVWVMTVQAWKTFFFKENWRRCYGRAQTVEVQFVLCGNQGVSNMWTLKNSSEFDIYRFIYSQRTRSKTFFISGYFTSKFTQNTQNSLIFSFRMLENIFIASWRKQFPKTHLMKFCFPSYRMTITRINTPNIHSKPIIVFRESPFFEQSLNCIWNHIFSILRMLMHIHEIELFYHHKNSGNIFPA